MLRFQTNRVRRCCRLQKRGLMPPVVRREVLPQCRSTSSTFASFRHFLPFRFLDYFLSMFSVSYHTAPFLVNPFSHFFVPCMAFWVSDRKCGRIEAVVCWFWKRCRKKGGGLPRQSIRHNIPKMNQGELTVIA